MNTTVIASVEAHKVKLTGAMQESGRQKKIPRGVGPLTFEALRREMGDWSRFANRRQTSSYTGLCLREQSSGGRRRSGSVSKSGNPRVRAMLMEMVWRMITRSRALHHNAPITSVNNSVKPHGQHC